MVEYGLLVGLIGVVAISSVQLLGDKTSDVYATVAGELSGVASRDEVKEEVVEALPPEPVAVEVLSFRITSSAVMVNGSYRYTGYNPTTDPYRLGSYQKLSSGPGFVDRFMRTERLEVGHDFTELRVGSLPELIDPVLTCDGASQNLTFSYDSDYGTTTYRWTRLDVPTPQNGQTMTCQLEHYPEP